MGLGRRRLGVGLVVIDVGGEKRTGGRCEGDALMGVGGRAWVLERRGEEKRRTRRYMKGQEHGVGRDEARRDEGHSPLCTMMSASSITAVTRGHRRSDDGRDGCGDRVEGATVVVRACAYGAM